MSKNSIIAFAISLMALQSCTEPSSASSETSSPKDSLAQAEAVVIEPLRITDTSKHDTDDPAIWIHPTDPSKSLIVGTDKDEDGALYVYDLKGTVVRKVTDLKRPNNVDIAYGLTMGDSTVDIAVTGERLTHDLRIFRLPDMKDLGRIAAFTGETGEEFRDLMGIALYKDPVSGEIYAIVGRKQGPKDGTYLWQYRLYAENGVVKGELLRKFGQFSGKKEIEAIVVDDKLGYVYYSDETVGTRKYYAHPDSSNTELALFGYEDIVDDNEGLSIYELTDSTGYLILSDQQAGEFHFFPREGTDANPHAHPLLKQVKVKALESDGSEVTSLSLIPEFKGGLFVAMSEGKVFHYYRWTDLAGEDLQVRKAE